MKLLFSNTGMAYHEHLVKTYGRAFRVPGMFGETMLYVHDPKAMHHLVVKDTHIYEESDDFLLTAKNVFGKGLLATIEDDHRRQRKMLTPAFSIKHMREMTPTFYGIIHKLRESITQQVVPGGEVEIDLLSWMTRTALELIGQGGFGYSFDTLEHDAPEHPYSAAIKNYLSALNGVPSLLLTRLFLSRGLWELGSPKFRRAVIDAVPWKKLHELRDLVDIMDGTAVEIFESSKRALNDSESDLSKRIGGGKDVMSALLKANMTASEEDRMPDDELIAQISTFIFAGMDTTSNALARILHLLSEHQEVQDKLRQEVSEAYEKQDGDLDYDTLNSLEYLDAVCRESLRLHPPAFSVLREAKVDGVLPLGRPIITTDGREVSEIFVPKGTKIFLSIHHCNREEEIWGPDAAEWKPERWMAPLPSSVADARVPGIYSNMMTFLGGGRACIGFKFSQLEMKVVLSLLVQRFKFAPSGKKVVWLNNGIVQPSTENSPLTAMGHKKLHLPLNVSFAKPA
ncbi:hypothetical protein D9611_014532 [Ephemerocybe angulata]|uniref:Cytochrome P450 n=1 Tax=Ephemerocybe angulata TaxID=980116 RepID=A0A8H5F9A2_9AGAR|nr:hypothetical protein D9611_014532 [Tulosesus angulatus]